MIVLKQGLIHAFIWLNFSWEIILSMELSLSTKIISLNMPESKNLGDSSIWGNKKFTNIFVFNLIKPILLKNI